MTTRFGRLHLHSRLRSSAPDKLPLSADAASQDPSEKTKKGKQHDLSPFLALVKSIFPVTALLALFTLWVQHYHYEPARDIQVGQEVVSRELAVPSVGGTTQKTATSITKNKKKLWCVLDHQYLRKNTRFYLNHFPHAMEAIYLATLNSLRGVQSRQQLIRVKMHPSPHHQ